MQTIHSAVKSHGNNETMILYFSSFSLITMLLFFINQISNEISYFFDFFFQFVISYRILTYKYMLYLCI